jgi:ferric-dicitrate binding protein FerR (iron transport regulator)
MKSEKEIDDGLLVKYLSGEASPEEAMMIVDWLQEPDNKFRFKQFETTWNATAAIRKPEFNSQKAWSKINNGAKISSESLGKQMSVSWWSGKTFRIAASLLIVSASAVFLILRLNSPKQLTVTTQSETSAITLVDQSRITLFRFSSLEYPSQFKKNIREINFAKGEAFFQVAHDAQKPFIIHTSVVDVRVVGTEFNVKVINDQIEVSVKEGKVLVVTSGDSTYLTSGLTGIFHREKKINVTNNPAENNVWSYATHQLIFKDTPLSSVIKDIQKSYPCSISFANSEIGNCKLTATFDNDSVDKVIDLIAETLSLRVNRNGEVFVLEGEGCP